MKYAISACLMGINCKYNGGNNRNEQLLTLMKDQSYILICPELAGGLSVPRACCEIVKDRVMNTDGDDVSAYFIKGAETEMKRMRQQEVDCVILQPRSPSCGVGQVYDGSFQGRLTTGNGIFVQMCKSQGIPVWNCEDFLEKEIRNLK